jgi:hypothetical protein
MNLSKLTFAQAFKLASPENIVRLDTAYHSALRRAWEKLHTKETFSVGSAAHRLPEVKARYAKIQKLIHSSETLYVLLADLAKREKPLRVPGAQFPYFTVFTSAYASQGFGKDKYAFAKASLLRAHCEAEGIPAFVQKRGEDYCVLAETDAAGAALIGRRPGLPWKDIVRLCWGWGCQPRVFFWWLPPDFELENGLNFFGGYLNPRNQPENSPSVIRECEGKNYLISKQ